MITAMFLVLLILLDVMGVLVLIMLYRHLERANEVLELARRSFRITDEQKDQIPVATADKVIEKLVEKQASESGQFKQPKELK